MLRKPRKITVHASKTTCCAAFAIAPHFVNGLYPQLHMEYNIPTYPQLYEKKAGVSRDALPHHAL